MVESEDREPENKKLQYLAAKKNIIIYNWRREQRIKKQKKILWS